MGIKWMVCLWVLIHSDQSFQWMGAPLKAVGSLTAEQGFLFFFPTFRFHTIGEFLPEKNTFLH